jgi:protein TonB
LPGSGQTVPGTGEAGPGVGAAAGPGAGGEGGSRDPDTLAAPDWVTKPSFEEMMRLNPRWAQVEGVSGGAVLACRIDKRKKAHSCRVLSESPKGYGFADAAVRAVKLGRLKPPGANGLPQYRAWVRIPIHFRNCRDKESGCRPGVE